MRTVLVPVVLFAALAVGARAQETPVEPAVEIAFADARAQLPPLFRDLVEDVDLERAPDLAVPLDAPLEYRLLGRAAHAAFGILERRVRVFDAGALGRATWIGEAPDRDALAAFLAKLHDLLDVEAPHDGADPSLDCAWVAFVAHVFAWRGEAPPHPTPPVGDPSVLDRFLDDGTWRALGGRVSRDQLLFHELAHALHLRLDGMETRMGAWATLSGIVECASGEPTDGFATGFNRIETPIVLVRLLFADDPEHAARGDEALYRPHRAARFVDRYARFDLREDFAECARLMAFDPGRLARIAPEKFLYLNTLGWNAMLDRRHPGPLWYDGDQFRLLLTRDLLRDGLSRLLADRDDLPRVDPFAAAAVLRAHAHLLRGDDLPAAARHIDVAPDLPANVRDALDDASIAVTIDGSRHTGCPSLLIDAQDRAAIRFIDWQEFARGIDALSSPDATELREDDARDVVGESDPETRGAGAVRLLEAARGVLPDAEIAAICAREAKWQAEAGRPAIAARIVVAFGAEDRGMRLERARQQCRALGAEAADENGHAFDLVELRAAIAMEVIAHEDLASARAAIDEIPGAALGAFRRMEALTALRARSDEAEREEVDGDLRRNLSRVTLHRLHARITAMSGIGDGSDSRR